MALYLRLLSGTLYGRLLGFSVGDIVRVANDAFWSSVAHSFMYL